MHRMVQGDEWELYIPSELGYGETGHVPDIPGHAVLVFQLHMVAVDCPGQVIPKLTCQADTGQDCSDRELAYLAKVQTWSSEKLETELMRLNKLLAGANAQEGASMKEELKEWIIRREYLLLQVSLPPSSSSLPEDEEL